MRSKAINTHGLRVHCFVCLPTMQSALVALTRALTRLVDLVIATSEQDEWSSGGFQCATQCKDATVAALVGDRLSLVEMMQ